MEGDNDGENLQVSLQKTKYKNFTNDDYGRLNSTQFHDNNSTFDEEGIFEEDSFSEHTHGLRKRNILSPRSSVPVSPAKTVSNVMNSVEANAQKNLNETPDRMFKIVFAGDAVSVNHIVALELTIYMFIRRLENPASL